MSKCKECGSELAEGAKFCGECGAKVTQVEKVAAGIDWDSPFTMADFATPLTDEQAEDVAFNLNRLTLSADPNRVVLSDSSAFKEKIGAFTKVYLQRMGEAASKEAILDLMESPIGFVDFGIEGLGKRGTLFARKGIFYVTKDHPKVVDGEPVGGFVPWKVFYKFGKPRNEKCYCLVNWKDVLASSDVGDDVKENFDKVDEELISRFFYINTGLSQKDVEECMRDIKAGLVGDESEPAEEDFEEEDE